MNISEMDTNELVKLSAELGAENSETFEESENRFRNAGEIETAEMFKKMIKQWYKLEE